jgi:hypothetical protein
MRHVGSVLLAAAAALVLTGCGFDRREAPAAWSVTTETLPTGAVRVVNTPPASGIDPTWVMEEDLRIGALDDDGPASFGQIKGLVVDDQGRIVVLESQAQELRVFGPDGRPIRTLGRRGEGPGEMRNANGLLMAPDGRIWVPDPQLGRMSVFDIDAGHVEAHPWRVRQWGWVFDGAIDPAGRVIVPSNAQYGDERWQVLRIYNAAMEVQDSVRVELSPPFGTDVEHPSAFRWEVTGGWGYIGVPFYAGSQRVVTAGPGYWLTVDGDASYRVVRWEAGRDTTLVIETRRAAVPVTVAERDSAMASVRETVRERGGEARLDPSRVPPVRPAVSDLFVSTDGDLWVHATTPDRGLATWDVYDATGRYRGTAVGALRPYRWVRPVIRGDRFWAVVTDELDVQHVVAGRLVATADGRG